MIAWLHTLPRFGFWLLATLLVFPDPSHAAEGVRLGSGLAAGQTAGSAMATNGASVSPPRVAGPAGKRKITFDFHLGPDVRARQREAELARLSGAAVYGDPKNASAGRAVGVFGKKVGDAILFEGLPAEKELNVLYNNGTGSRRQCGLYVEGNRVGTLVFEDTKGWFVPFVTARYEGPVSGSVKLQIDAQDLAGNGGDFCCNVDRIVAGPFRGTPSIEVALALGNTRVAPGSTFVLATMSGPTNVVFSLGLEDAAGVRHWNHGWQFDRSDIPQALPVAFADCEPPLTLEGGQAMPRLLVRAVGGPGGGQGTFALSGLEFSPVWPSLPPAHCPFPPSKDLTGLTFTGRHAEYTGADTWYPSWAADGNLYSPWTDGTVNGLHSGSGGAKATTGSATILGEDPLNLTVVDQTTYPSSPAPYEGRYPCGSLVYRGIWYYGTYCLHPSGGVMRDGINYNWPWLGPFVGFRTSTDFGKTWTQTPCTPAKPLFGESALNGEPVKIGAPHFVDLGRELEHSPDGKAYLVGHGASDGVNRRYAFNSWITGDEIYLTRVTPGLENMNDATKYEFFGGADRKQRPVWTNDFQAIKPIAAWRDNMGCVTMTYNAPLRKYLMCVTDGGNTVHYFNTYILESEKMTGPWRLVTYLKRFGEQAYFVNIPSKFISPDGGTFWLCYAANFSSGWGGTTFRSRPTGSRYAMCLQEVKLVRARAK
jgi:hypothetical protein